MPGLSRLNDQNDAGGAIQQGANTVFCNGIAVGLHGPSQLTSHNYIHTSNKTTEGSPTVFAENLPVLRIGSGNDCGHQIVQGSEDVFVQ